MSWLHDLWRKMKSPFSDDDVLNAENEDALREHSKAVEEMRTVTEIRKSTNTKLREVLLQALEGAAEPSPQFGEFERSIRKERRRERTKHQ
jgi:hypothetical protein